jgi:phosphoribosylaminoimidazolecarboxamide formyltransferase/IMP cyclohydrolase
MIKIRTALISVFDKTGVLDLAKNLAKNEVQIISSGGTAKYLKENNIKVTEVTEYTGFNEIFDGRVKTLHPKIHAGILARGKSDESELKKIGAKKIDLVVANLYPFADEVANEKSTEKSIIEKIDIGGPAMIRAAAKNYKYTVVATHPQQYQQVSFDEISEKESKELAADAFELTYNYDLDVSNWFLNNSIGHNSIKLRYGENPHQDGFLHVGEDPPIDFLNPLQGKEISYNNVSDSLAAWACVQEFNEPSVCIVKHTNPCGVASSKDILESYKKAFQTDPTSAFGGVIACNNEIEKETANYMVNNQFIEVLIAPSYTKEAIEILQSKPNIRVLRGNHNEIDIFENRIINGIGLVQSSDTEDFSSMEFKHVTKISPTLEQLDDLIFAMKVAKHGKSNAIVLAKNKTTLGVGVGQMSRVISTKIAFLKAEEEGLNVKGCVLASDAFFPFRDNIDFAASKGVSHIIQPGGSVKDEEVIKAADENNLSMTFTGVRHFKH